MVFQYDVILPAISVIAGEQRDPEIGDVVLVAGHPDFDPVEGRVLTVQVDDVSGMDACTATLDIYVDDDSNGCPELLEWLLRKGEVGLMIKVPVPEEETSDA